LLALGCPRHLRTVGSSPPETGIDVSASWAARIWHNRAETSWVGMKIDAEDREVQASEAPTRELRTPGAASTMPVSSPSSDLRHQAWQAGAFVDRYQLTEPIGAGGMGVVWSARDADLGRDVALKLIRADRWSLSHLRTRLLGEARAMARLSHPNVVTVHDAGVTDEALFIAMERHSGGTLAGWLGEKERSWREVVATFVAAGRGLSAAHAAGLVHRDFKPDNVLVGKDGVPRVSDFGLALPVGGEPSVEPRGLEPSGISSDVEPRGVEPIDAEPIGAEPSGEPSGARGAAEPSGSPDADLALTQDRGLVGTLAYMAPEQLLGQRVTPRSDQFSFCVSLHEALYGSRPFGDPSTEAPAAVLLAAIADQRLAVPSGDRKVPERVHRILVRGLACDPAERWPSMDDVLSRLEGSLRTRRRWWPMAVAAALAAAALALFLWPSGSGPSVEAPPAPWALVIVAREGDAWPGKVAAISSDGALIAYTSGERVWLQRSGSLERTEMAGPPDAVISWLALSHDGAQLAAIGQADGTWGTWTAPIPGGTWRRVIDASDIASIDFSRDGRLLVGQVGALVAIDAVGRTTSLVQAGPDEKLGGARWSPSGRRIAFWRSRGGVVTVELLDVASRAVRQLMTMQDFTLSPAWVSESRLLVVDKRTTVRRDRVLELVLGGDGAVRLRREVHATAEFENINQLDVTDQGTFMQSINGARGASRLPLDRQPLELEPLRISPEDTNLAGWTTAGELVMGANLIGSNDVLLVPAAGPMRGLVEGPTNDVPIAVIGDVVWICRSGEKLDCTIHRVWGGAVSVPLLTTMCAGELLACAGDRAEPCLFGEAVGKERRFVWWDPMTGERGAEALVTSWPRMVLTDEALSADGTTLALGRLLPNVELVDLRSGSRRTIETGGAIQFVTWSASGDLYATDSGGRARLLHIKPDGSVRVLLEGPSLWFGPVRVAPDGRSLVLIVKDSRVTYSMEPELRLQR
jgi:serine/threonine protein kinase